MGVKTVLLACVMAILGVAGSAFGMPEFAEIPLSQVSQPDRSAQGQRALSIRPQEWHHAETPHFVLHFFHRFIAAPVSVEAEFYDRYITADLGIESAASGTVKSHLYLFETQADWAVFCQSVALEPWTGAVTIGGSLFVPRYPEFKWKGNALGHEIAHLIVHRSVGTQLPLWLEEGYAEDVSDRGYKAFYRARGYQALPREPASPGWIPLARLTAFKDYPAPAEVTAFYRESRSLTAFLIREAGKERFLELFKAMAGGTPFQTALGSQWNSLDALESAFKNHAQE